MSLLKRSPAAPRAPRPVKPRVFLSKEDRRTVNRLRPIERQIGWGVAVYTVAATLFTTAWSKKGFSGNASWHFPLGIALAALFAFLCWRTNRWLAGIGAIGVVYGANWDRLFVAALVPLGYFVWLNLKIFRDQRAMMEQRAAEGNLGVDPRTEAARNRAAKKQPERATEDATGRQLASASKRYTPPKAAKKKR